MQGAKPMLEPKTHFEQIPVKIVKKIAIEVPEMEPIVDSPPWTAKEKPKAVSFGRRNPQSRRRNP
jgi:hypothetical protein